MTDLPNNQRVWIVGIVCQALISRKQQKRLSRYNYDLWVRRKAYSSKQNSPPKKNLSASDRWTIAQIVKKDHKRTTIEIIADLNERARFPQKLFAREWIKPDLTGEVQSEYHYFWKQTLHFVYSGGQILKNWSLEQWKNVMFVEESLFTLFLTTGQIYVRESQKRHLTRTAEQGGGFVIICPEGL